MTGAARNELLTSIVAATRERLSAAACSVALLDGAELEFCAADGVGSEQVVGLRMSVGRGIAGWVVASGQTVAIADTAADARFDRDAAARTGYLPTSILATPVDGDDGPVGVLEVLDRAPEPRDMQVAADAARQVTLVLALDAAARQLDRVLADPQLAELVALLRGLATTDVRTRRLAADLLTVIVGHAE